MKTPSTQKPSNHILPLFLPLLALTGVPAQASIVLLEDFETDGLNTRYTAISAFTDGADDYFTRTDGLSGPSGLPAYTNFGGSWFWAAEDIDGPLNPTGTAFLDFAGIDLQGFPGFRVSIDIGAGTNSAFDLADDFVLVQFRFNAGPWNTALAFQNDGTGFNSMLRQDTDFDGIGDGAVLGLALQTITSAAFAAGGGLMDLRIDTLVNAGSEAVAFDNITVIGVPEPSAAVLVMALAGLLLAARKRFPLIRGE